MSEFKYFPIIKTRDSELRCFENVKHDEKKQLLPIYELTKSRKTKVAPDGDINRRMTKIGEIQGDLPFILDLSTDPRYCNPQIDSLLSHQNGFLDWQYFVFDIHGDKNIIPMVHIYEDEFGVAKEVEQFVTNATKKCKHLAVRLPYDLSPRELRQYIEPIVRNLNESTLYVVLDGNFLRNECEADFSAVVDQFIVSTRALDVFGEAIEDVIVASATFPSNPAQAGKSDSDGEFKVYEFDIYKDVVKECAVKFGDYTSINTEQIEIKGGTFVPRIDIFKDNGNEFFYKRFRRKSGSYEKCAKFVLSDTNYTNLGCWADSQIYLASSGKPTGISPSFWISVRMNYYIHQILGLI